MGVKWVVLRVLDWVCNYILYTLGTMATHSFNSILRLTYLHNINAHQSEKAHRACSLERIPLLWHSIRQQEGKFRLTKELRSKLSHFRIYDLRHTWATRAAMSGIDLVTLASLLGHSKINIVMRYAHPTESHQRLAMKRLEQFNLERQMEEMNEKISTKVPTLINWYVWICL